jgi:hypothetical protein
MPHLAVPFPAGHASGSGRFGCRLSSRAAAAVSACPCRRRGCPPCRPPAGCGVRRLRPLSTPPDRRCPPAAPTWPATQDVRGTGDRGSVRWTSGSAGQVLPDGRHPPRTRPQPLSRAGTWRSPAADRRCTPRPATAVDANRPHAVSTAAAEPRPGRLSRPGCPPHGVLPQPADTAAVSTVLPEPRPLGCRPDGWCPPRTPPPAGVRCYRKRSPDRWRLVWCRHRR